MLMTKYFVELMHDVLTLFLCQIESVVLNKVCAPFSIKKHNIRVNITIYSSSQTNRCMVLQEYSLLWKAS